MSSYSGLACKVESENKGIYPKAWLELIIKFSGYSAVMTSTWS